MPIKIALILSIILQFGAAIIALTLVKRTRTNIAWWLISGGFLLMAIRRVFEIIQAYNSESHLLTGLLSSWTGVLISMVMLLSLIFIKRIFNIQTQIDNLRQQNEARVLSAILKTEEKERQHFAKELHDGLGPLLSSVKMSLSASRYNKNENGDVLENAEKLIDESILSLKDISNKLSPHVLINFGLQKAIASFINKMHLPDSPEFMLKCNFGEKRFGFNIEVVVYRIVCELITNTIKHAKATKAIIELNYSSKLLSILYIDNGVGFDIGKVESEFSGMGYDSIKSRINSLNGKSSFQSSLGTGVTVNIEIKTK